MSAAGPRNATFYHLNDPEMAEPSPSELIRLLARFADLGVLEAPQVVSAIGDMAGSPTDPDPGAATLLDALEDHRNSTSAAMPAVNTVIDQVKRMRHAAADRFHRQNKQGQLDLKEFQLLLGDLPLEQTPSKATSGTGRRVLTSTISLARDRRFLAARRGQAPTVAEELDRQYDQLAEQTCAILDRADRRLVFRIIYNLRQQLQRSATRTADAQTPKSLQSLVDLLDQLQRAAESPVSSDANAEQDSSRVSLESLETQFHAAENPLKRQQALDSICVWSSSEFAEVILKLIGSDPQACERADLILTCRFGKRSFAGWASWENALQQFISRSQHALEELVKKKPAELLLIWAGQQEDLDPQILDGLQKWCDFHSTPIGAEDFVERWEDLLTTTEFNALLGIEFVDEPAETSEPAEQQEQPSPAAPAPAVAATPAARSVPTPSAVAAPPPPPPPTTSSIIWREHIQPLLTENWYMVAGIVMVLAGASLISVYFWDQTPIIRFTLLPAMLAAFTLSLASVGSWIERQDIKFRGSGAMLRGAAIALLPMNFMVLSLLAGADLPSQNILVVGMGLIYVLLFGWSLRSWCRAVYTPLGSLLGGALLAINCLVMIGPLAESLAQQDWAGLPLLIAIGFHAGFACVAWTVVRFAGRMLTPELATEKRVPWFVGGTLSISFLQVFGWVHFQLGQLPQIWTYSVLVILVGWLVLFVERRSIEVRTDSEQLGGESFLGYSLVLLGVLMGAPQEYVRIAVFALAGIVWLYQAARRNHEVQHWIGLTLLSLSGASVALLSTFPRDPWLPMVGLVLALLMGGLHRLGRQLGQPDLSRAALGMQPTLAFLTAVVAMLAQWHFRSPPLWTAGFLLGVVGVFAWRAWRDQELRWVHSAMAIVGLSLPYLGCVDMLGRQQLHGNTMVFGLSVVSFGWLGLIAMTRSQLLRQARSTVLMVYGSIAVAAMVLRVLFEQGPAADPQWWRQAMDYSGPLLMAALLAIATYHTRSLLPAAMAATIAVILFPELRARFHETFDALGWGTGLGSSCSALGLVLSCFVLIRAAWLQKLEDGDLFFGRIPFPFRRFDHTLFTWPLAASAVFLCVRTDTWTLLQNALPGHAIANLFDLDVSGIPLQTAISVSLTGVTWTLLAVLFRDRRGAVVGTHLGWITLLLGLLVANQVLETPWRWQLLETGLILQVLEWIYRWLGTTRPWSKELLVIPIQRVLFAGTLLLSWAYTGLLVVTGESEFMQLLPLIVFYSAQLVRGGLVNGSPVFGGSLFALIWVNLLSLTSAGTGHLLHRLTLKTSLTPTLWLLLSIQAMHLLLEFARPLQQRLQSLLSPILACATALTIPLAIAGCFDAIDTQRMAAYQHWLLWGLTLLTARNHGCGWLGLLALIQGYLGGHLLAGRLEAEHPVTNVWLLIEPWRCAALGLTAAILGQTGHLLNRQRSGLLVGPFAQPAFRSQQVGWMFVPAVTLAIFACLYHTVDPHMRGSVAQLVSSYLAAGSLLIVAWSCRSQTLAWVSAAALGLGNIHSVRLLVGTWLQEQGLSEIHLISLGLVATLLELTALRTTWRSQRVSEFVNRASLTLAGLVLALICFNYVTDPGLAAIPWIRFVVSGVMAYVAGLYFRYTARNPGPGEEALVTSCEAGYHFGVTLAIWCAALLIPWLREPKTALFALAIPVVYFYVRAEQGFASGFAYARRYRDSAAGLSFAVIGLWVFRIAFHLLMFPDKEFDFDTYHANAPLIMLLSLVMIRLYALGGTDWLALYGGLSLVVGSFFTLTWMGPLKLLDHPIAAAWCGIGLAHFWTLVSHQRSPLRTAVLRLGRIDGPDWFRFRRTWGMFLLFATHITGLWALCECFGVGTFPEIPSNELMAAPLLLGTASVLVHLGIIRRSVVYLGLAAGELLLALHAGFVIESYLPREQVIWAILGLWTVGLAFCEFGPRSVPPETLGPVNAGFGGLAMLHILFYHSPDSTVGLWAFAAVAGLVACTPRSTRAATSGEQTMAAGLLLIVPTWLVFFSQVNLSDNPQRVLNTWTLLTTTASVFTTGCLCRWFQVRLLAGYDSWHRAQPRLFDQTLSLAGRSGGLINSMTLWFSFVVAVVVQLTHYREPFQTAEIVLLSLLYSTYAVAWYFEGQQRRTMSAYVILQLCILGLFSTLRRQLMNVAPGLWTPEYDVWTSLVVSFGLCGAKQVIDVRPREIRIPLMGTLLGLPAVALIWVLYNQMGSDVALLVVGLHSLMFTFLGKDDRQSPYNILAVGGFVTFVLILFWTRLELKWIHAYVIPVGLGILILLQLFRDRIAADARNRIRLVTLLAMLSSAGYYALVDDRHPLAFNLTLIVISLLSMGLGSFLRVRLYLFLGFVALLVDVASIMFKVIRLAEQSTQRAAIGGLLLVVGIGLVGGAIYYKTHRDQINDTINRWRQRLGAWE